MWIPTLPFYSEYKSNPTLKAVVKEVGGPDEMNANAMNSLVAALLFEEAAKKVVADGNPLNRQTLLDALENTHKFDAGGLIGPMDIGNHEPNACYILMQVKDGEFVRVNPTKAKTFDCNKKNIEPVDMDLL
jgi:ABC-type branched-subunit amino acid transport system substrate-binding protein